MQSRQKQSQTTRSALVKTGALLLSLAEFATADQPVHCIKDNVIGDWTYKVTKSSLVPDLFDSESVCTHELPNKLQIIENGHDFQFQEDTYDIHLTLHNDYSCTADSSVAIYTQCNWSMMYDQAMLVWLDEDVLMANFRYEVKPNSKKGWENLQTGDYDEFNYKCQQTMVGVLRNKEHKDFACAVGQMTSKPIRSNVIDNRETVSMAQTSSLSSHPNRMMSFAQTATSLLTGSESQPQPTYLAQTTGRLPPLHDVPEETRTLLAQKVNENPNATWTANSYSQIEMEKISNNHQFNFAQTKAFGQGNNFAEVLAEAQKFIDGPDTVIFTEEELTAFDWSNFGGHDFVGKMMDQKSCGSCYMIATITMLESRIKIFYGEERSLSSQMPLQCNFLTEGCHGGWGLLGGMFLESYWTVDEHKAPYKASTPEHSCKMYEGLEKVASVEETYYVGGAYGKMSEESLMKEIRARGPVLFDFNAGYEFMTFQSGTLTEQMPHGCTEAELWNDAEISTLSQEDKGIEYQKLTHSTLVVGWGVDRKGMKFWKVRNSYGGQWGEQGHFNVRKGHNDFGGEGENSAVIPICHNCSNVRADLLLA